MNSLTMIDNKNASIWESADDLKQIKEIYGKNLSSGEFNTLVQMGRATGLNPFLREIWAVKYGDNPAQIFIGRDGYRKSAQRSPYYDYHVSDAVYSNDTFEVVNGEVNHKYNLQNRGTLMGAYCTVQRKGSSRPGYVFVELKEYTTGKSLWNAATGKQATMIKKVAEAQGLKGGFQELFAGTYSEFEEWKPAESANKPGKGVQGLKEKLGLVENTIDVEVTDEQTGEIFDQDDSLPFVTKEDVIGIIDKASNLEELLKVRTLAKTLPDEDKKSLHVLYKRKERELSA